MLHGGGFIGVLSVRELGDSTGKYNNVDARLLSCFARQAASAVLDARLFEQTRRRLTEMDRIKKISVTLRNARTLEEMMPALIDEALQVVGSDTGVIWLYDNSRGGPLVAIARGGFLPFGEPPFRLSNSIAGYVFASGQPYTAHEFINDPHIGTSEIQQIPAGWGGVFVPISAASEVIGVLCVCVKLPREVNETAVYLLNTLAETAGNEIYRIRVHESLEAAYHATLEGWSRALDLRDKETESHTQRVVGVTLRLACAMGVPEDQMVHIRRGALLHDIGKMAIPDGILFKQGPLSDKEREIMREHPVYAYEMLSPIAYLQPALDIPYCHHEKWDGLGYPRGLKGEEIPLAARIFAVVDVWDALRSTRPYRSGWIEGRVREHIRAQSGIHFDPRVVEEFLRMQV